MCRRKRVRPVCASLAALLAVIGCSAPRHQVAPGYELETLVPGSAMHGVHGLAFGPTGTLYGASLTGYSIYRIDTATGTVETAVGPPLGNADDVAVAPDGTIAWTSGAFSAVHALTPDGEIITLADKLPAANSINYAPDGRLFVTQVFGGDALWEIDPEGRKPPRLVAKKLGGLNGFEIGPDGWLYGPRFLKGGIVRVNVETGEVVTVADGFTVPAAVNFDSHGRLYVVDFDDGTVTRLDVETGRRETVARLEPPLDNLAISNSDEIYVSNPALNTITAIDAATGKTRAITTGQLSSPGGIALATREGRPVVVVADFWGNRYFDRLTGARTMLKMPRGVTASASLAVQGDSLALASIWPFGLVYLVDTRAGKIVKTAKFEAPYDPVFLADGSVVVADYGAGTLARLAPGKGRDRSELAGDLRGPVGVAADADGIYVAEYDAGRIWRISLSDGARALVAEGLDRPEGLAIAADGTLFVAETGRRRLLSVDVLTGEIGVIADELAIGLAGGPDLPKPFLPTGVAVDETGDIYVAADIDNAVYRIRRLR